MPRPKDPARELEGAIGQWLESELADRVGTTPDRGRTPVAGYGWSPTFDADDPHAELEVVDDAGKRYRISVEVIVTEVVERDPLAGPPGVDPLFAVELPG